MNNTNNNEELHFETIILTEEEINEIATRYNYGNESEYE